MFGRILKDRPKVFDQIRVLGGGPKPRYRGIRLPNGEPVPVETIMEKFGVSREEAELIAQRQTR